MTPISKILIGAVGTAVLAVGSHMGMGQGFIDHLTGAAHNELAAGQAPDVAVAFGNSPLTRVAQLSGPITDAAKQNDLLARVKAIPGVADAHWVEGAAPIAVAAAPEKPATAEAVKNCQADVDAVIKGKTIEFASGTSTLTGDGHALVDALAQKLGPCQGTSVEVQGHTDATGSVAGNQRLSEARANAVTAALVEKGVPATRLVPKGFGSSKPIVRGVSPEANAKNRRIDFAVMAATAH